MPKFGNAKGKFPALSGKGGSSEMLPNRHALNKLTKGDPVQRSLGNYAKLVPSGSNTPASYRDIIDMGTPRNRG